MPRTSREEAHRIQRNVLSYIAEKETGKRSASSVSYREIGDALGYSQARVRHACRKLVDSKCMHRKNCFAKDGGQRPNAYVVTLKGRSMIEEQTVGEAAVGGLGSCGAQR